MKETLRSKVEKMLSDAKNRHKQLLEYIDDYKERGDWEAAMKCHIKSEVINTFIARLNEALN